MDNKIRKRAVMLTCMVILLVLLSTSCASMLAGMFGLEVDPPESEDSSLLFVELIAYTWDEEGTRSDSLVEVNYRRGFFPIVVDEMGNEVAFSHIEGMSEAGIVYHSANLPVGNYMLKGFRYLWMTHYNFMHSPIVKLKFDGQRKDEFIEIQEYPLPEPVKITVEPGKVASLGSYKLYYELREYDYIRDDNLVRMDDDYKMISLRYENINPEDTQVLKLMQNWTYKPWVLWNQRNPLN